MSAPVLAPVTSLKSGRFPVAVQPTSSPAPNAPLSVPAEIARRLAGGKGSVGPSPKCFLSRSIELSHSCVISGTWVSAKKRALDKPPSTVACSVIANGTAGPRDGPAQPSNVIGNSPADRRSSERRRSTALPWPARAAQLRPGCAVAFPERLTIVVNRFIASATSRRLSHLFDLRGFLLDQIRSLDPALFRFSGLRLYLAARAPTTRW